MKITRAQVEHVAQLARLALTDEELDGLTGDMDAILGYVDKLTELDTDHIVPTAHAVPVENVFRPDRAQASIGSARALQNAPEAAEDCFVVPKVIE
jgi:aspartyl-tRNA(Asn)/glutamyl-tRNA(Gln) amidotransferase subunit C